MKRQGIELHIAFTVSLTLISLAIISILYPLSGNPIFIHTRFYSPPPELSSPPPPPPPELSSSPPPPPKLSSYPPPPPSREWSSPPPPELSSSPPPPPKLSSSPPPPPSPEWSSPPPPELSSSSDDQLQISVKDLNASEKCDLFSGEWVPNPESPYYTNTTCREIHEHQNCMKYGRPDADFLKWRWKPDACELPIFNPAQFLEIVRGKSMAFVGDSLSRNQVQSLICLLSRVTIFSL